MSVLFQQLEIDPLIHSHHLSHRAPVSFRLEPVTLQPHTKLIAVTTELAEGVCLTSGVRAPCSMMFSHVHNVDKAAR